MSINTCTTINANTQVQHVKEEELGLVKQAKVVSMFDNSDVITLHGKVAIAA